jgi:hypothetical protein
VLVLALLTAACSEDAPDTSAGQRDPAATNEGPRPTLPPPASHEVFLVSEGLVDPVPVPGEPERRPGRGGEWITGTKRTHTVIVDLPAGWLEEPLFMCSFTLSLGFYGCFGPGLPDPAPAGEPMEVPDWIRTHGDDDRYELWLTRGQESRPLRRLVALEPASMPEPTVLRLAPGYDTVNDVLGKQPPPDGNYLVVVQ